MSPRITLFVICNFLVFQLSIAQLVCIPADAEKLRSTITLPIDIALSDVERLINNSVTGLIYEDNSYTDNDNDQFKVKVWKTGNLRLRPNTANQFSIAVPLKVWAEKGYGAMGYYTYKDCTFQMEIRFKTVFSLSPDWSLRTVTTPDGYTWISKPELDFGPVTIPITPIVERILNSNHASFSRSIDDQIKNYLNFKPYALNAWNMVSMPYLVSDEYKSWLKVTPLGVKATPLRLEKNTFITTLGFDIISQTFTGCKPDDPAAVKNIPQLQLVQAIDPSFNVNTAALIDYNYATELAMQYFNNYKMEFAKGNYELTLHDITVNESDGQLAIYSQVSGDVNGSIILKGQPYYDNEKKEIAIRNTQFDLKTKNLFQKSASWIFNGLIEKNIEKNFKIPATPVLDATLAGLIAAINKEYYKGVSISGKINNMSPTEINAVANGLQVILLTGGEIKLQVTGL